MMDRYNNRYEMRRQGFSGRQMNGCQKSVGNYARDYSRVSSRSLEMTAPFRTELENIEQFPIAMAYVPWQRWNDTYDLNHGLTAGTIFPELDKPFLCSRCVK